MTDSNTNTSRRRLVIPLVLALVVVGAIAVWQVADSDDDDGGSQAAHAQPASKPAKQATKSTDPTDPGYDGTTVPIIQEAQPEERELIGLLRSEPDGMPAKSLRVMGKPIYGMNPKLAKSIPVKVDPKYGKFWFAPADQLMCIVAHNYATHRVNLKCALTKDALTKGVVGTFIQIKGGGANWGSMTKQLIVGVAPDGVRKAHLRVGPETTTVPVVDNLFFYTARSHENPKITYEPAPQSS